MDFNDIMKQAQEMQDKMQQIQGKLSSTKIVGESEDGKVKVLFTGMRKCLNSFVDAALLQGDKQTIEVRMTEAINNAMEKIEKETQGQMHVLTDGLELPEGMDVPEEFKKSFEQKKLETETKGN